MSSCLNVPHFNRGATERKPSGETARRPRSIALLLLLVSATSVASEPAKEDANNRTLRGRVVWLAETLEKKYGIKEVPEAAERVLVLETPNGELHPLVEDIRGRGFRRDARLRNIDFELLVRQHPGVPFVQVIRVYQLKDGAKYELDYWCDVCAIAMFELKDCECCQGPIELRSRRVKE